MSGVPSASSGLAACWPGAARCSARCRSRSSRPARRRSAAARRAAPPGSAPGRRARTPADRRAADCCTSWLPRYSLQSAPADLEAGLGRQADEGVAPEPLAALHRLQQIGPGPVGELEVDGQGRVEIGEGLEDQRDAIEPLGSELPELATSVMNCSGRNSVNEKGERQASSSGHAAPRAPRAGEQPALLSVRLVTTVHDLRTGLDQRGASTGLATIASASSSRTSLPPRVAVGHADDRAAGRARRRGCRCPSRRSPAGGAARMPKHRGHVQRRAAGPACLPGGCRRRPPGRGSRRTPVASSSGRVKASDLLVTQASRSPAARMRSSPSSTPGNGRVVQGKRVAVVTLERGKPALEQRRVGLAVALPGEQALDQPRDAVADVAAHRDSGPRAARVRDRLSMRLAASAMSGSVSSSVPSRSSATARIEEAQGERGWCMTKCVEPRRTRRTRRKTDLLRERPNRLAGRR